MLGSEAETEATLAQLVDRAGTDPAETELTHGTYRATKRHLAGEGGAEDGHIYTRSEFFARPLPGGALAQLVGHIAHDRVPGQARELDFSPWGGAYNRTAAGATAFPHRDARFLLKHAAVVEPRGDGDAARARGGSTRRGAPCTHGAPAASIPNFPDPELEDPDGAYFMGNLERVRRVEAAYDPDRVFASRAR